MYFGPMVCRRLQPQVVVDGLIVSFKFSLNSYSWWYVCSSVQMQSSGLRGEAYYCCLV